MGTESSDNQSTSSDSNSNESDNNIELNWPYNIPPGYQELIREISKDEQAAKEILVTAAINSINNVYINQISDGEDIPQAYRDLLLELQEELGEDCKNQIMNSFGNIVHQTYLNADKDVTD